MTIRTTDRDDADLDIAAEERSGVQYPLNHVLDSAGTKIDPATETTLAALNVIAAAVQSAVEAINGKTTAVNTGAIAGTVALDAPTLAALETINVGNLPATQTVAGTVALDAPTLAALESIQATTGGLTNTELRAAPVPVGATGELVEAIEALRMAVQSLNRSVGLVTVDLIGRQRTVTDVTSLPTLANVTTVASVTNIATLATLTTLANQANIGGIAANHHVPATMQMSAGDLRRNILVS